MFFRPAFWMTVCTLPSLAILFGLGTWQLQRLEWKQTLIAELGSRATGPAITAPVNTADIKRFQRMRLSGEFLHEAEVQLTGRTFEGTAGYHVVTPMRLDDGRILMVNRGWVSQDYRRAQSRPASLASGPVELEAILRLPKNKGYFVPDNDIAGDDWFTLDIGDITAARNLDPATVIAAYSADAMRAPDATLAMPIGAVVSIDIANDHLGYAMTWYGIGLGLIGVYGAWHHQTGRLGFGKKRQRVR